MKRVAIVVLNWNGINDTLACLGSLLSQSYKLFHIVVIDNDSTDNSKELLDKYQTQHNDNVEVIYSHKNLGFASGVNVGIKWALKKDFEYVALFNNDAIADKNWLQNLVDVIQAKENGISTGLFLHKDGKTIDSTGDWYSIWGLPFPRNRDDQRMEASKDGLIFGATGGASLYKIEMLKNIGLFDEDFFAYYEDVDISFRAQLAGWKVAYSSSAVAYHKQGVTSKKMPGFTVYQTFKNLPLLFLKNVPGSLLFPVGIRFYFAYVMMFFNAIAKGKVVPAIKGAWMSFVLGFKKISERRKIQKNRQVSTKYIKSILWNDLPPDQTGLRKLRRFFTDEK